MKNKKKVIIIAVAAFLIVAGVLFFIINDGEQTSGGEENPLAGSWYSDRPDMLTLTSDGKYTCAEWNGGHRWLFDGTYTVSGDKLTLSNALDGSFVLNVVTEGDGSRRLTFAEYSYYETENEALEAFRAKEEKKIEDEKNRIPNTSALLLGDWISDNERVICTYTEDTITLHYLGYETLPEKYIYYEYELISDTLMFVKKVDGASFQSSFRIYEKDGVTYLNSPVADYSVFYSKIKE